MRRFRGNGLLAAQVLLLAAGLGVLATLQYRWLQRVADAEREHIRQNLMRAATRLDQALVMELRRVFDAFHSTEGAEVAPMYRDWLDNAPNPELVPAMYVAGRQEDDSWSLQRFNPETGALEPVEWPAAFAPIRKSLDELSALGADPPLPVPLHAVVPAMAVVQAPGPRPFSYAPNAPVTAIVLPLDRKVLAGTLLPSLVARDSAGNRETEYDVALLAGKDVVYQSSPSWPDGRTPPDITRTVMPMHGPGAGRRLPGRGRPELPDLVPLEGGERRPGKERGRPRGGSLFVLQMRQREGGLESIVTTTQRRNLAVSFGILGVLGATVVTLLALLRRGERLRVQQAQFVAAISHELNTPLTALRIVGENLERGTVQDREKLVRYARTIVKESTRLSDLINQVLELSGMRARTQTPLEAVDVHTVVEDAVASCRLLTDGDIQFEVSVEPGLPPVAGRSQALTRAVQNLLTNAIRHAGSGKWVGVRAASHHGGVRITVEDRGPGIASSDAAHLFEPFYRGRNSTAVRGAGLGLTIVREIVADHGGSIEIDARRKEGAAFTIQLPARAHV